MRKIFNFLMILLIFSTNSIAYSMPVDGFQPIHLDSGDVAKDLIKRVITNEAKAQGVDPALALAVASHESKLDPGATNVNSNGSFDTGLFQINSVGVKWKAELAGLETWDLNNINDNVKIGVAYLKYCIERAEKNDYCSTRGALTYYNRGNMNNGYADDYIKKVLSVEK